MRFENKSMGRRAGQRPQKNLPCNPTYQFAERTLTDDVLKIRRRIVHQLEKDLNARLRGQQISGMQSSLRFTDIAGYSAY